LLPLFATPFALLLFWKRKTIGWSLLILIVAFTAAGNVTMLYKILFYNVASLHYDSLYRSPVRGTDIFYIFILIGILYVLCKRNIRDIYNVDVPKMGGLIFIGGLVGLIFNMSIY
jgi:hypothetical protein